jgi:hypothetical protein
LSPNTHNNRRFPKAGLEISKLLLSVKSF